MPYEAAYSGSKAALAAIAESARAELEPEGITFTAVFPGFVDTPMFRANAFKKPAPAPASRVAFGSAPGISYPIAAPRRRRADLHGDAEAPRDASHFPAREHAKLRAGEELPARLRDPMTRRAMNPPEIGRRRPWPHRDARPQFAGLGRRRFRDTRTAMATISGVITAMVTPFAEDGALDLEAARRLARHLVENGSHGLVVAGHDGRVADALRRREARPA